MYMKNTTLIENKIVRIIFNSDSGVTCEAVGILLKKNEDSVEIGFNAINDVVKDFLVIPKKNIKEIQTIDPRAVVVLR